MLHCRHFLITLVKMSLEEVFNGLTNTAKVDSRNQHVKLCCSLAFPHYTAIMGKSDPRIRGL